MSAYQELGGERGRTGRAQRTPAQCNHLETVTVETSLYMPIRQAMQRVKRNINQRGCWRVMMCACRLIIIINAAPLWWGMLIRGGGAVWGQRYMGDL